MEVLRIIAASSNMALIITVLIICATVSFGIWRIIRRIEKNEYLEHMEKAQFRLIEQAKANRNQATDHQ